MHFTLTLLWLWQLQWFCCRVLCCAGSVLSSCRMPSLFISRMRRVSTLLGTVPARCIVNVSRFSSPTSCATCLGSMAFVRWNIWLRIPSTRPRLVVLCCLWLLVIISQDWAVELPSYFYTFLLFVGKNVLRVTSFTCYIQDCVYWVVILWRINSPVADVYSYLF